MKRLTWLFAAAALFSLAVSAGEKKDPKDIRVGVSVQWLNDTYIRLATNAMEKRAKEVGITLAILDGEGRPEKQVAQIENLIAQDYDVVGINPHSMDGCAPAIDAAVKAGVPIFTLIQVVKNQDKANTYVGSDAVESGRIQGEMIYKMTGGKGKIALIMGPIGADAQIGRKKGLLEALAKGNYEIVVEETGNWQRDQAQKLVENWLQADMKFDIVAGQNDNMAMGALKAVEDAGMADTIKVWGIDATQDACRAVKSGRLMGTVFQNAEEQGRKAIDIAVMLARGEPVAKYELVPYLPVDKSNIDQYVK